MAHDNEEDKPLTWEEFREMAKSAKFCCASEISEDGTEWRDLQCPKCGCDKIVCRVPELGEDARCYECGHEFTITENCWKLTRTMDGSDDDE